MAELTSTATITPTAILSATATLTPTAVLSATATLTPTAVLSATATLVPTAVLTATATFSPTAVFTATPTATPAPPLAKPPLRFGDEASALVKDGLGRSLAEAILPGYPIAYTFRQAQFVALKAAPFTTYSPRLELTDAFRKTFDQAQVSNPTAIGLIEVGKDPQFAGSPRIIEPGAYIVAVDLPSQPKDGETARGVLAGRQQKYYLSFTAALQVVNPARADRKPRPLEVTIAAGTLCFYTAQDGNVTRFCASGQPQPLLSVKDNFPERYAELSDRIQGLARLAKVDINSDQIIAEMEDPAKIDACNKEAIACTADIVVAPVSQFPDKPDGPVTAGVMQFQDQVNYPTAKVPTGDYTLHYLFTGGSFRGANLTLISNPAAVQPIPAVPAWFLNQNPQNTIPAQISGAWILVIEVGYEG